jgi:rSAM/selenodomain-associated transferase 1
MSNPALFGPKVLGVFARRPVAGQVKTRLAAQTSPEWAARVAAASLADTLDRMSRADVCLAERRFLVHTPDDPGEELTRLAGDRYELAPQGPGLLGERLARFIGAHVGDGPVVVIGSDSPTLPDFLVGKAYRWLSERDVVLGPATDGGYYLIGCRRFIPSLFTGIDWGSRHVLRQSVQRLEGLDVSLCVLQPWYDVDTLDDWHMMAGHLVAERRAGLDPQAPRTEALIHEGLP